MAFNYTCPSHPLELADEMAQLGVKLEETVKLLEKIDIFPYPLHGFSDIGGIHNILRGGVVLSNHMKSRPYSYEMTVAECMAKIKELDAEIQKNNDELSTLHTRYKKARDNHDDDKANRLEEEMGYLGRNRQGLESTKEVYQEAICNGKYKIEGYTNVLGEYDSTSNQVILYYKSISSKELLAVVYVHEMMHAYLDCSGITLPKIEEPIVEYGMLCFFKAFGKATLRDFAQKEVKNKQNTIGLAHYGFGHCIFMNPNRVDWLNGYLSAKPRLLSTSLEVKRYLDIWRAGLYPIGQEQACLQALFNTLYPGKTKRMNVKEKGVGSYRIGSRQYTINGKGRYSMYEVVEEFVKFLQGQGRTIIAINQEIQQYLNSRWIFVSSNPGKVAWSNEKGEYFSLSGFYITKQWKGNTNGNFTRLVDIINQQYNSFQIVEI